MEVGADEGENISFDLHFDGTNKPSINGKSNKEFMAIYNKHFIKKAEAKNEQ